MEEAFIPQFEATLERISQGATLDDLSSLMAELRAVAVYGLAHLVHHAVQLPAAQKPNPILLLTYEPVWVERYTERDYFRIDPVVRNGRKGFQPGDCKGNQSGSHR